MSLADQAYDIVNDDFDNFEQFGLEKLLALWPQEHKLAVLQAQKEDDWDSESQIELSRLCEHISLENHQRFLSDVKMVFANMY